MWAARSGVLHIWAARSRVLHCGLLDQGFCTVGCKIKGFALWAAR